MLTILKRLIPLLFVAVITINPATTFANTLVEVCVQNALANILKAQNVSKYVAMENVTRNIVGPQWKTLTEENKK